MIRFVLRALAGVPVWLLYFALMIPLMLLGAILIPAALILRRYIVRMDADGYVRSHWRDRWMWLWDNDEDGVDGLARKNYTYKNAEWAGTATDGWSFFRLAMTWSVWRNSVGNARRVPFFGLNMKDPKDMVVYTLRGWGWLPGDKNRTTWPEYRKLGPYVARYGIYWELKFPWGRCKACGSVPCSTQRYFWIGWRIAQQDIPNTNIGFAFQPWSKL